MKILAVDTSEKSASIALLDSERVVAEASAFSGGANAVVHSVWLMPNIHALLKEHGVSVKNIDIFAVVNGPGSFTGLRIGISAVKGMAWALDKRVFGVSSLSALALNARLSKMPVCALIDAHKGEVYAALYSFEGESVVRLIDSAAFLPCDLIAALQAKLGKEGQAVFLGSGLIKHSEEIKNSFKGAIIAPEDDWRIKAECVGRIALKMFLSGEEPTDVLGLKPLYLRRPEGDYKPLTKIIT